MSYSAAHHSTAIFGSVKATGQNRLSRQSVAVVVVERAAALSSFMLLKHWMLSWVWRGGRKDGGSAAAAAAVAATASSPTT